MTSGHMYCTQRVCQRMGDALLGATAEEYLQTLCRLENTVSCIRINFLAAQLNVEPGAAAKMAQLLAQRGYVQTEKYGTLTLTDAGRQYGAYITQRHGIVHAFLCAINGTAQEQRQTMLIEHFLEKRTVHNMQKLTCSFPVKTETINK